MTTRLLTGYRVLGASPRFDPSSELGGVQPRFGVYFTSGIPGRMQVSASLVSVKNVNHIVLGTGIASRMRAGGITSVKHIVVLGSGIPSRVTPGTPTVVLWGAGSRVARSFMGTTNAATSIIANGQTYTGVTFSATDITIDATGTSGSSGLVTFNQCRFTGRPQVQTGTNSAAVVTATDSWFDYSGNTDGGPFRVFGSGRAQLRYCSLAGGATGVVTILDADNVDLFFVKLRPFEPVAPGPPPPGHVTFGAGVASRMRTSAALVAVKPGAVRVVIGAGIASHMHVGGIAAVTLGPGTGTPANSALPATSGVYATGAVLSASQGTWTNSPTSYAYQWMRDGSAISGATSATYVLTSADAGHVVSCRVTAANSSGSAQATSTARSILGYAAANGPRTGLPNRSAAEAGITITTAQSLTNRRFTSLVTINGTAGSPIAVPINNCQFDGGLVCNYVVNSGADNHVAPGTPLVLNGCSGSLNYGVLADSVAGALVITGGTSTSLGNWTARPAAGSAATIGVDVRSSIGGRLLAWDVDGFTTAAAQFNGTIPSDVTDFVIDKDASGNRPLIGGTIRNWRATRSGMQNGIFRGDALNAFDSGSSDPQTMLCVSPVCLYNEAQNPRVVDFGGGVTRTMMHPVDLGHDLPLYWSPLTEHVIAASALASVSGGVQLTCARIDRASNTDDTLVPTTMPHWLQTGDVVTVRNMSTWIGGGTTFTVTVIDSTNVKLNGATLLTAYPTLAASAAPWPDVILTTPVATSLDTIRVDRTAAGTLRSVATELGVNWPPQGAIKGGSTSAATASNAAAVLAGQLFAHQAVFMSGKDFQLAQMHPAPGSYNFATWNVGVSPNLRALLADLNTNTWGVKTMLDKVRVAGAIGSRMLLAFGAEPWMHGDATLTDPDNIFPAPSHFQDHIDGIIKTLEQFKLANGGTLGVAGGNFFDSIGTWKEMTSRAANGLPSPTVTPWWVSALATAANPVYASPTGTASYPGTLAAPCSIRNALNGVVAGDKVLLAPGQYDITSTLNIARGGTSSAYVRITSLDPSNPAKLFWNAAYVAGAGDFVQITASGTGNYVIIDNIEIDGNAYNSGIGIHAQNTITTTTAPLGKHHVIVQNCDIHHCGGNAIGFEEPDYVAVLGCKRLWLNGHPSRTNGSAISLRWRSPTTVFAQPVLFDTADGWHNIIDSCRASGSEGGPADGEMVIIDNNGDATTKTIGNTLVRNCTAYNNGNRGFETFNCQGNSGNNAGIMFANCFSFKNGLDTTTLTTGFGNGAEFDNNKGKATYVNCIAVGWDATGNAVTTAGTTPFRDDSPGASSQTMIACYRYGGRSSNPMSGVTTLSAQPFANPPATSNTAAQGHLSAVDPALLPADAFQLTTAARAAITFADPKAASGLSANQIAQMTESWETDETLDPDTFALTDSNYLSFFPIALTRWMNMLADSLSAHSDPDIRATLICGPYAGLGGISPYDANKHEAPLGNDSGSIAPWPWDYDATFFVIKWARRIDRYLFDYSTVEFNDSADRSVAYIVPRIPNTGQVIRRFRVLLQQASLGLSTARQTAPIDLIEGGYFDSHLATVDASYKESEQAMMKLLLIREAYLNGAGRFYWWQPMGDYDFAGSGTFLNKDSAFRYADLGTGGANSSNTDVTTSTTGGGKYASYDAVKLFRDTFPVGTPLQTVTCTDPDLAVTASMTATHIINKNLTTTKTFTLDGSTYTIAPKAAMVVTYAGQTFKITSRGYLRVGEHPLGAPPGATAYPPTGTLATGVTTSVGTNGKLTYTNTSGVPYVFDGVAFTHDTLVHVGVTGTTQQMQKLQLVLNGPFIFRHCLRRDVVAVYSGSTTVVQWQDCWLLCTNISLGAVSAYSDSVSNWWTKTPTTPFYDGKILASDKYEQIGATTGSVTYDRCWGAYQHDDHIQLGSTTRILNTQWMGGDALGTPANGPHSDMISFGAGGALEFENSDFQAGGHTVLWSTNRPFGGQAISFRNFRFRNVHHDVSGIPYTGTSRSDVQAAPTQFGLSRAPSGNATSTALWSFQHGTIDTIPGVDPDSPNITTTITITSAYWMGTGTGNGKSHTSGDLIVPVLTTSGAGYTLG